jgi:hypothetical protein
MIRCNEDGGRFELIRDGIDEGGNSREDDPAISTRNSLEISNPWAGLNPLQNVNWLDEALILIQ